MTAYDKARETGLSMNARGVLMQRTGKGEVECDRLLTQVANMHIVDKLVPPARINIFCKEGKPRFTIEGGGHQTIHTHALGQMCSVIGFPRTYATRLQQGDEWEQALFEHNMNELFHKGAYLDRRKQPTRFLVRSVGDEVRGFLSRSFNRHLASLPLLRGFVYACGQVNARPVEATTSPVSFSLKSFLPFVFEPVEGEFIAFGASWSNSDFGAGRMRVSLCIMRILSATVGVLEDSLSRVHIGSIIQDSDLEVSDETAAKEVEAQVSAIHDTVKQQLAPESVNRLCTAIAAAHDESVPWHRIKSELGRLLQKKELEDIKTLLESDNDVIDLPPVGKTSSGEPIATRWWASNVVGWMATKEPNPDRRGDLQALAGDLLKVTPDK